MDPEGFKSLGHVDMTVRELLTDMKDNSEIIVDLAYASLMYNSDSMAAKVHELEDEIKNLKYAIRYKALLSARTKEDARQMSGLLQVASAADRIADAADEIVDLIDLPLEKRPFVSAMLYESGEKIRATKVRPSSGMVGYTIGELAPEACTGCKIIAIKTRQGWIYDPEDDVKVRSNDDIIVRGTEDGFNCLLNYTNGLMPWEFPEESAEDGDRNEVEVEAETLEGGDTE